MKHLLACLAIAGLFFFASCGGSSTTKTENADSTAVTADAPKAAAVVIDVADWVDTDLSATSNLTPVSVKLPKDAKLEKNGNGGVDIKLNDAYTITVSTIAVSNIKEAMESDKSLTVNNTTSYKDGKVISEDANGMVYSMTMKDEANGTKYEPETHFAYYLNKDGAIYSIMDVRPMDNFFLPGSSYTEDNAKKLFDIVKSSAKVK